MRIVFRLAAFVALTPCAAFADPAYQITEIGLTGANYSYSYDGGIFQNSVVQQSDPNGPVAGYALRYNSLGNPLGQDAWIFEGDATQEIGLTGTNYSYTYTGAGGGTYQSSGVAQVNAIGEAIGSSSRYDSSGDPLGSEGWLFNGTITEDIGLTIVGGGDLVSSGPSAINDAGQAMGTTIVGHTQDAWFFNGSSTQQIGLTGGVYSRVTGPSPGQTIQQSDPYSINSTGQVIGTSGRYSAGGGSNTFNDLGEDAWVFNGVTTQQVGLTGPEYNTTRFVGEYEAVVGELLQNNAGEVAGATSRFNASGGSNGSDAWIYNGTTEQIGLTGANYSYAYTGPGASGGTYEQDQVSQMNSVGDVVGTADRFNPAGTSLGLDYWLFNGSASQQIGLTGPNYGYTIPGGGTYENSFFNQLNNSGQVIGASTRYNASGASLGADSWIFNGSTTAQIGLTGGDYSYVFAGTGGGIVQLSTPAMINDAGQVAGVANRFDATGNSLGQDVWFYNGATSQLIGLTGTNYGYSAAGGTYENSGVTYLNNQGQAIGFTNRYSPSGASLGQAGWFFDPTTNATSALEFSISPTNVSYTYPDILTDNGIVLGSYVLFNGSVLEGDRAFYWTEAGGFRDLGALIDGGLTSQGWQYLADVFDGQNSSEVGPITLGADGSLQFIWGDGLLIGQTGGNSVYFLTSTVPEPASCSIFGAAVVGLLWRGKRKPL